MNCLYMYPDLGTEKDHRNPQQTLNLRQAAGVFGCWDWERPAAGDQLGMPLSILARGM